MRPFLSRILPSCKDCRVVRSPDAMRPESPQPFFQTHRGLPIGRPAKHGVITHPVRMPDLPHFPWSKHWRISYYRCGDLIKLRGDIHRQLGHVETKRRFSAKPPERFRDLAPTVSPWVSVIQLEHAALAAIANQPFHHRLR